MQASIQAQRFCTWDRSQLAVIPSGDSLASAHVAPCVGVCCRIARFKAVLSCIMQQKTRFKMLDTIWVRRLPSEEELCAASKRLVLAHKRMRAAPGEVP